MTVERGVRLLAGLFILISLGLGYFYSPYWYLMTAFVGLNLLQSGITGWCLAAIILQKLGLRQSDSGASCGI
ncbi:MAG: YgaP family membrane protein [Acidobacteriaceae bacterium]